MGGHGLRFPSTSCRIVGVSRWFQPPGTAVERIERHVLLADNLAQSKTERCIAVGVERIGLLLSFVALGRTFETIAGPELSTCSSWKEQEPPQAMGQDKVAWRRATKPRRGMGMPAPARRPRASSRARLAGFQWRQGLLHRAFWVITVQRHPLRWLAMMGCCVPGTAILLSIHC